MIGKRTRKKPSVLHPKKRYPISREAYAALRIAVYQRSKGFCENTIPDFPGAKTTSRCWEPMGMATFDAHHKIARSKGGQDTLDNLLAICRDCHSEIHGKPQWSRKS